MPRDRWDANQVAATAPARDFEGTVWRVHWREVAATDWQLSLRTSGRYHRGGDLFPPEQVFLALYTSLAPEIAVWEMVRRSAARNLTYLRNNILSELKVQLHRVLDLADPSVGDLTRADLTGPDYHFCQELAAVAVASSCDGLLIPSAALLGTNLVIFPRNLVEPVPVQIVSSRELPLESVSKEREGEGESRH